MTVELIYNTPLWIASKAIRKCWASEDKSDTLVDVNEYQCNSCGEYHYDVCPNYHLEEHQQVIAYHPVVIGDKDKELIERVGNKNKHKSTLEHLVYTFDIDGISRACLQEVARHRIASYSVKSTRYTLKELKDERPFLVYSGNENGTTREYEAERVSKYCVLHKDAFLDDYSILGDVLSHISNELKEGRSNDEIKHLLPEAYKTSLVMTINARSLQNFLELRTNKSALWEIRDLAYAMYEELPEEHKYLFKDYLYDNTTISN